MITVENKPFFNSFASAQTPCSMQENDRLIKKIAQLAKIEALGNRLALSQGEREVLFQSVSKLEWRERERYFEAAVKPMAQFFEKVNTAVDVNSAVRNTFRAILCLPVAATPAAVMSLMAGASQLLGGIAATVGGGVILARGLANGAKAFDREDWEGLGKNALFASFGVSYATVGVAFTLDALDLLMQALHAAPIWSAAGMVVVWGVVAMSAFQLLDAALELGILFDFEKNLKARLEDKEEPEEANRLKNVLKWIQAQVSLSDSEILEITTQAASSLEAEKKMAQKLQGKWDQFERRTNRGCGQLVHETLDEVLLGLETNQPDALGKARSLIEKVEEANYKEQIAYKISFVIALISLVAAVCAIAFLGPGALVPIFFAIGALMWLTIDNGKINGWVSEVCWAQKQLSSSAHAKARQQVLDDLAAVGKALSLVPGRENSL